ncbi:semaphorin-4B isoform X2 [Protopterus annectens]|uniref:semaphorin-4B isoform X2 n=1 Tax=Protopterus annectens TaxID=7888 RepID=UPI001CF9E2B3|nr:semaphorin-4B isoform X2 [Protopterus annectens]
MLLMNSLEAKMKHSVFYATSDLQIVRFQDDPERAVWLFSDQHAKNYTSLLLSADGETLYVGARETLFALNVSTIWNSAPYHTLQWVTAESKKKECVIKGKSEQTDCYNYIKIVLQLNSTHLYMCGTYSFSPSCTYVKIADFSIVEGASEDGKGRCPFDPHYSSTAIMVDGELYTGTVGNFLGNEPIISRSLNNRTPLKTESSLNWLEDSKFVGSAYIQESHLPGSLADDDDKIYFFFSEIGKEYNFFENIIVSRIARVCKGDLGGDRVLQKRWTTFLKAQLLCSLSDDGFPFNVIQDMFVLTPGHDNWKDAIFYGVFTSQWYKGGSSSSAVCAFTMDQVEEAFNGSFKEVNRELQYWYTYTDPLPEPRPGSCITRKTRGMEINSSLQVPDKVLNFIKDHFLMDKVIKSQPQLLQKDTHYQQITVHRMRGISNTYDVLFLGTDNGRLHKAVTVKTKSGSAVHIIEEVLLFPKPEPVQKLLLNKEKGWLYASSTSWVAQLPIANCSAYQSCGECILSRDPYCAWTGKHCRNILQHKPELHWKQDIENADTKAQCQQNTSLPGGRSFRSSGSVPCDQILMSGIKELPCKLSSNLATIKWFHNNEEVNSTYPIRPDGSLMLGAVFHPLGIYECWSMEEGFAMLSANYCVETQVLMEVTTQEKYPAETTTLSTRIFSDMFFVNSSVNNGKSSARVDETSYWKEFLIVCILFAVTVVAFTLFLLCRHRDTMKSFLKEGGDCPTVQQKKQRKGMKPNESLPLNGNTIPNAVSDHKGYQTLNDNYIVSTPVHEVNKDFSESEKRPLNIKDTHVDLSPTSPRPRVRLGSEIRDSVV